MRFVEIADLKTGMRLARPIYNKKGVLLFERDSKLVLQSIDSIRNFGLLGVYILEPAEPLPPMSQEDMDFEHFQIMTGDAIRDELEGIIASGRQSRLRSIVNLVLKNYGYREDKINFYQNLRSRDDYVCRHALNTAILCALITRAMNVKVEVQQQAVTAALLHDIGKMYVPREVLFGKDNIEENNDRIYETQLDGLNLIESVEGPQVRRICMQVLQAQHDFLYYGKSEPERKMVDAAKILLVANRYDELTAMDLQGNAETEVKALYEFRDNPALYDKNVVSALLDCINVLPAGVSVELNTGERALVLSENRDDVLRPTVLAFRDNSILDLSAKENSDIRIVDVVKTMDNRYVMDSPGAAAGQ